jgi:hypothetical protein
MYVHSYIHTALVLLTDRILLSESEEKKPKTFFVPHTGLEHATAWASPFKYSFLILAPRLQIAGPHF